MIKNDNGMILVFVAVILLTGLILAGLKFHKTEKEKIVKRVRIAGYYWNVEQVNAQNGQCYYVYAGTNKVFTVPCEMLDEMK